MPSGRASEKEWLNGFLMSRGLSAPDGRPLYAYRCSAEEAIQPVEHLRHLAARVGPSLSISQSALFCLYAAEWWRRNHEGGAWKWEGILESLEWSGTALQRLYPVVEDGLGFWQRKLLTTRGGRGFLVTLACEGGLPLKLLRREQSSLRRYFHALLQDFQLFRRLGAEPVDLAARSAHLLRSSLRQDVVYELSGSLVNAVWELQRDIGGSRTPLAELDRCRPNWRDTIPLVVEDDTAQALLNNLVEDAARVASRRVAGFSVARRLRQTPAGWVPEAEIRCPPHVEESELAHLAGVDATSLPARLHVYADDGIDPPMLVALASRAGGGDGRTRFVIENPSRARTERRGAEALRAQSIVLLKDGEVVGRFDLTGGNVLAELPWLLVESSVDAGTLDYVGQGTVRSRSPEVFVAALPEWTPRLEPEAVCVEVGTLANDSRLLYRVAGTVAFVDPSGGECRLTAGAEADQTSSFELRGPLIPARQRDRAVYRGIPKLFERPADGMTTAVPANKIEWRSARGDSRWRPLTGECLGDVQIRFADEGTVRFRGRALIAPETASLTLIPKADGRSGVIELRGFGTAEVGLTPAPNVDVTLEQSSPTVRMAVTATREAPGAVEVVVRWDGRREIALDVPFPVRVGRFLTRHEKALRNESVVSVERLGGMRARVMDVNEKADYALEGSLLADDVPFEVGSSFGAAVSLQRVDGRGWELDLRTMQDCIRTSLAMSRRIDALFRLKVVGSNGIPPRSLFVRRFDAHFEIDRDTGEVRLSRDELDHFDAEDLARLRVEAVALWDPSRNAIRLEPSGVGRWDFLASVREPGPWLIIGWDGTWARIRPTLWTVGGTRGPAEPTPGTLHGIVCTASETEREAAFDLLVRELSGDVDHPDWPNVYAYFEAFRDIPKSTLQLFDRLIEHPRAAAVALLGAPEERFDLVWYALEELPFCWDLVPVADWLLAAETVAAPLRTLPKPLLQAALGPFFDKGPRRLPGLQVIAELIQERVLREPVTADALILRARHAVGRTALLRELASADQRLTSLHAEDRWPTGMSISDFKLLLGPAAAAADSLWRSPPPQCGFRLPALAAPIGTALCSAAGVRLTHAQIHTIRNCRSFDVEWFEHAYRLTLALAADRAIEGII